MRRTLCLRMQVSGLVNPAKTENKSLAAGVCGGGEGSNVALAPPPCSRRPPAPTAACPLPYRPGQGGGGGGGQQPPQQRADLHLHQPSAGARERRGRLRALGRHRWMPRVLQTGQLAGRAGSSTQPAHPCPDRPPAPQERVHDAFVAHLVERVRALKMGSGLEEGTTQGPLITPAAVDRVRAWARRRGRGCRAKPQPACCREGAGLAESNQQLVTTALPAGGGEGEGGGGGRRGGGVRRQPCQVGGGQPAGGRLLF